MRVLLINPPKLNTITTNVPELIDDEKEIGYVPPIGLLYVASMAEYISDCKVEVLDAVVEKTSYQKLEQIIKEARPDVVGIYALTFTLLDVIQTAKIVKKINNNIHISLGGPHVAIFPEETINIPEVDSIVLNEGEYVFAELLTVLKEKGDLSSVSGLMFKKNGIPVFTGTRDYIENLDLLRQPARHLLPIKKYWSILSETGPITSVISSRGCPYKCNFCDRPNLGKKFRFRSAENIAEELETCKSMGIKFFIFYDDTFTVSKERVYEICSKIIKRKLNIKWDIRARVDSVDENILRSLKEAGCVGIHFGVESGNEVILKNLNKGITLDEAERAFRLAKKYGLKTLGYFMLGNPGETKKQMFETIKFARMINPDYIHISLFTPFPGTPIYDLGLERGILKRDYWKDFASNPTREFVPSLWEESLNRGELIKMLREAYRDFYTRPAYLFASLSNINSVTDFARKVKIGLRLFTDYLPGG